MNKLEQAMEDHKQGNWQQADTAYAEIISEEPENAEVMYLLATSQMSQNNLDDGLVTIEKAIEINPKAPAFHQVKGDILARLGQADAALKALKKALKDNPNLYQPHIVAGHIYYTKGIKKDAEKHFRMAMKIEPNNAEAQTCLAKIFIDDGEVQTGINMLRNIEQQHPEQASVKMMMGQAYIENGAYNFAENYFKKVLAMHPDYGLAGLYLGVAKLHTGDVKNAEKLIYTFNQQYQNTREGLAALGILMFKNNRFRAAAEYLRNAIGKGLAPMSWRAAFVESLARLGQHQPAIDFYTSLEKKNNNKVAIFRLGELYELQGKAKKARKQYKQVETTSSKYIAALLGLARCYLKDDEAEKAEKQSKKVLQKNAIHAEAKLLLLTSLLYQGQQEQALSVLQITDYANYNDVYKKAFRLQHGLILDKQKKFAEAIQVFQDSNKKEQETIPEYRGLSATEVKEIKAFDSLIDDDKKDPVFIIGTQSTAINNFVSWLHKQGVAVSNDRLISTGRPDILFALQEIDALREADNDMVRLERKRYHQKAKALMTALEPDTLFADCMYINPFQIAIIKKFFPNAHVLLLTRATEDMQLNEQAFGKEPLNAKQWSEAKDQIADMGLNLTLVDIDKWFDNDKQTLKELSKIFAKELQANEETKQKYWQKTFFKKGHWKNYS